MKTRKDPINRQSNDDTNGNRKTNYTQSTKQVLYDKS